MASSTPKHDQLSFHKCSRRHAQMIDCMVRLHYTIDACIVTNKVQHGRLSSSGDPIVSKQKKTFVLGVLGQRSRQNDCRLVIDGIVIEMQVF